MIQLTYPELLLLVIPLLVLYRKFGYVPGPTGWLRGALILMIVFAATLPRINLTTDGTDLVIIVDRSKSMPAGAEEQIENLIRDVQKNLGDGDRVALVTFGSQAYVEHEFSNEALHSEFTKVVAENGSDLNEAILTALDRRVNRNRPLRILVMSDGEYNGASPLYAARRCREQNVPIDFRPFSNNYLGDIAVESIGLPQQVAPNEPYQFNVWLTSDRETEAEVVVRRNGEVVATKKQVMKVGNNRVVFRDWISDSGFYSYDASVRIPEDSTDTVADPVPQNNVAQGIVRVESQKKILVINHDGQEDNVTRALKAAEISYELSSPAHPLTQDSLDPFRAVILENVSANALGRLKMDRLAQFVEDLGGGLLMTGGRQSFATGGYYRSPLEEVLPVSLESRKETRRSRCALVMILDRSGSMSAPVGLGKQKMDLANLGTAECIKMLNSKDMVSVIAVDSVAHVVQPMTPVSNPQAIAARAMQIQSMGGGIFVYTGLLAGAAQMEKAENFGTRHIILFSDALDSEEPGGYIGLLEKLTKAGVTVSVIGLGTPADVDAPFLEDIARRGNGTISFTEDPQELPRLFAQDALNVTRSTFLMRDDEYPEGFNGKILPNIQSLGEFSSSEFPNFDGYNLTYLKENASIGVVSTDENNAPLSAYWLRGLGRVAVITPELDGKYSGQLTNWSGYDDFVITHARWLLGTEEDQELFVAIRQEGQDAVIEVEMGEQFEKQSSKAAPDFWIITPGDERSEPVKPEFIWTGPQSLQARFRMDDLGTYRTLVRTDQGLVRGPALTLPYSPEFLPRTNLPSGEEVLGEMAELTGGSKRVNVLESLEQPFRAPRYVSLVPWLCILSLIALVTEIAGRRLGLWQLFRRSSAVRKINKSEEVKTGARQPARKTVRRKSKPKKIKQPTGSPSPAPAASTAVKEPQVDRKADVFAKAKSRAQKRLK